MKKRLDMAKQGIYKVASYQRTQVQTGRCMILMYFNVILLYIEYCMKNSKAQLIKLSGNSRKQRTSKYKIFAGHKRHELEESGSTAYLKIK